MAGVCVVGAAGRTWLLMQVVTGTAIGNQGWMEFVLPGLWEEMALAAGSSGAVGGDGSCCRF